MLLESMVNTLDELGGDNSKSKPKTVNKEICKKSCKRGL